MRGKDHVLNPVTPQARGLPVTGPVSWGQVEAAVPRWSPASDAIPQNRPGGGGPRNAHYRGALHWGFPQVQALPTWTAGLEEGVWRMTPLIEGYRCLRNLDHLNFVSRLVS